MEVAELEEAEFAYLLGTLHAAALIGVEAPALFPVGRAACDEAYAAGLQQLQAHGWLKPLPQAGQFDLNAELMSMAAVVADPEFVIFTMTPQPNGYQRLFLHYLAGDSIVEFSKTLGCYRLLALPSQAVMFERVADMLGVFGTPVDSRAAPAETAFIINEPDFAAIKALAEGGAQDQAAAKLAAFGLTGTAGAALAVALARPEGLGMVAVLRAAGPTVTGGRKATLYGEQNWVWLVQRLEAASTRLQVQAVQPETLAAVLRQFLDFLKA